MMKSLKYLLISAFALLATSEVYACWSPWFSPSEYYMFRVNERAFTSNNAIEYVDSDINRNCRGWQDLTSSDISFKEIFEVVYTMPLKDFEAMYDNRDATYKNKFAEWITKKDKDILDFLLLAKTNEHLRLRMNSRWYYPTMHIEARMNIEEVAEKALAATNPRLRDRYLLQAVRALFTMTRYEECISLWENEASKLPETNLMRRLIISYIAGAEFRINHTDKAMEYFASIGDINSLRFCAQKIGDPISTAGALELACKYAPNSDYVPETLQSYIRELEPTFGYSGWDDYQNDMRKNRDNWLRPFCLKMAQDKRVENPAMWYYTAAFLSELAGETAKASEQLSLAEKVKGTKFIKESIKIMRIYLDAKLSTYDSAYEAKLFEQLKWLDSKIANNIDDSIREEIRRGYKLSGGISFYYWNDMLRRILLAEVCPRMLKAGKTTRALQLANMADNRLFNLINQQDFYKCYQTADGNFDYEEISKATMAEYRYSNNSFNDIDYSNHFFEMIDSLGVNNVKRYEMNVRTSKGEFDRYLNARGYTGKDYLNDIVGTQCLREMRYGEAVKYLAKVSDEYNIGHLNVLMKYDPFVADIKPMFTKENTKYAFAREMYSLEQSIATEKSPNIKAQKMFKYAVGLRNSFDRSWPLTQYYRGGPYWGCPVDDKEDWEFKKLTVTAHKKAKQYLERACKMATDDEVAANIQYELCNFKTVVEQYPNSQKAALVRGKCDKLYDYHIESFKQRY